MKEFLLLIHPTFGVLGILSAVWVMVEVINASPANRSRIKNASLLVALCMLLSWLAGGYLYTALYAADKALILAGPWPFAHRLVMEVKEHLFFVTLILSFVLPLAAWTKDLAANRGARTLVFTTAALIVLSGLVLEGAGAVIALGVKLGLQAGL